MAAFEIAVFGNRDGSHQLLGSSLLASDPVLDELRFLVDRPAGHVGPEVTWCPYWGCQSVGRWWVLWRGDEDLGAPRKNMVTARVVLVSVDQCATIDTLDDAFASVGALPTEADNPESPLAGVIASCLANGEGPAIILGLPQAPIVLAAVWPRLWPSARASLSLRTLFGVESLDSVSRSSIIVIPSELRPRWHAQRLLGMDDISDELVARWFTGSASPHEDQLIATNTASLPGDFTVLKRIERIRRYLDPLHVGTGTLTDALAVIRTQEAFGAGFHLPPEDLRVITTSLQKLESASVADVRAASLVTLDALPQLGAVEAALARWVEQSLPTQSTADALWILEQQAGQSHAPWWRRAVGRGVDAACLAKKQAWAMALWRWWQAGPESVSLTIGHLERTHETGQWLASNTPENVDDVLVGVLAGVCREREWATLFGRALGATRPLLTCVESLRHNLSNPEVGLDALLLDRHVAEIVDAAAATSWSPLIDRAVLYTVAKPQLLISTFGSRGFMPLLLCHLSQDGEFPAEFIRADFLLRVFDGVLKGDQDYLKVIERLDRRAGRFILDHPKSEDLLPCVNSEIAHGAADEWCTRFLSDCTVDRAPAALWLIVSKSVRGRIEGAPITLVMRFLSLAPEITEATFVEWLSDAGFQWESGDHQRMANILVKRGWKTAAKAFRWSWKRELKLVAWYAQKMLSGLDRFWGPPEGVHPPKDPGAVSKREMAVSFLAANPLNSMRLSLDEEARAIEEKLRDSQLRDCVTIKTRWAVRPEDLQQALLEDRPTIVHFSGHGSGTAGIVLHSADQAAEERLAADALADLFRVLKDDIRVVVLNACYSEVQARAIVNEIDFVVGMAESIGDDAAISFAAAFYRGLGFGRAISTAFDLGLNELKLIGLSQEVSVPRLFVRPNVDPTITYLVREA